jgi:hypothetical protein
MVIDRFGESFVCVDFFCHRVETPMAHTVDSGDYARTFSRHANFVRKDVGTQSPGRDGGGWREMFLGHVLCGMVVGLDEV